jgi:outer membrane protein
MHKSIFRVVLVIGLIAAVTPAFAQTKVAVIDVNRVVTESDPGKEALQQLTTLQNAKIEQGRAMQTQIDNLRDQINKQRLTLTADKLEEMTKQLEDQGIALKRFQDDASRELDEARRKALGELEQRIMPIIDQVGAEMQLTLIFNKYQAGLVYADESVDITEEVIRRFNVAQ